MSEIKKKVNNKKKNNCDDYLNRIILVKILCSCENYFFLPLFLYNYNKIKNNENLKVYNISMCIKCSKINTGQNKLNIDNLLIKKISNLKRNIK